MTNRTIASRRNRRPASLAVCLLVAMLAVWLAGPSAIRLAADEPPTDDHAATTAAPPLSADEISRWVGQLSDDSYTVRRSAADRLLAAGTAARPALMDVVDGPDPETRAAARRLVALIDRNEFNRRLDAFAADADGRRGVTLPGWEDFSALVGGDVRARALFIDMQRAEAPLLAQVFDQPADARDHAWEDRLVRLLHGRVVVDRRHGPPLGSCATMLFLGTLAQPVPSDRAALDLARLVEFPPVREAMQSDEHRDAVRRLVAAWIVQCPNHNSDVLLHRLRLALTYEMGETLPLAVAVATDPEYLTVPPGTRVTAILAVGKFGGEAQVADLQPLLEDETVCMPVRPGTAAGQPLAEVQIRDVALAAMLHLTHQDLRQYGFPAPRRHARNLYNAATLYMPGDAERTAAIKKWHQWRAEHNGEKQ